MNVINDYCVYHSNGKDYTKDTFDKRLYRRLRILRRKYQINDTEYIINLSDGDMYVRDETQIPVYCFATPLVNVTHRLIPDIFYLDSDGYSNIPIDTISWKDKKPIAFWRGKSSGMRITPQNYETLPRYVLCSIQHPALDAKISSWQFLHPNKNEFRQHLNSLVVTGENVDFTKFYEYKIQINIDGFGPAWNGFFLKLRSNAVVLNVESLYKQWYYTGLQPWVHYVPVMRDMSDLTEKIQWVLDNDEEAERIAEAGRKYINDL